MINLQNLKNELSHNKLKFAWKYIKIYKYLVQNNHIEIAQNVLRTAMTCFPNNENIKNIIKQDEIKLTTPKDCKIFCIGLSRTGTNSLSEALSLLGYEGKHWTNEDGHILEWTEIEKFQYLSDTPISFVFETLYYAYPDAYFIYTVRDTTEWVKSMDNHFKWAGDFNNFKKIVFNNNNHPSKIISSPLWGVIHKNLYANANSWEEAYYNFDNRVKRFFSSKPKCRYLQFDISLADNIKWELLTNFLDNEFLPLMPFPRKNVKLKSFSELPTQMTIEEILSMTDAGYSPEEITYETIASKEIIKREIIDNDHLILKVPDNCENHYSILRSDGKHRNRQIITIKNAYLSIDMSKKIALNIIFSMRKCVI